MPVCEKCGKEITEDASYCTICNTSILKKVKPPNTRPLDYENAFFQRYFLEYLVRIKDSNIDDGRAQRMNVSIEKSGYSG